MKIAVLAAVLAVASAQTVLPLVNKIDVVYIKTADCDGCGMTDGQVHNSDTFSRENKVKLFAVFLDQPQNLRKRWSRLLRDWAPRQRFRPSVCQVKQESKKKFFNALRLAFCAAFSVVV